MVAENSPQGHHLGGKPHAEDVHHLRQAVRVQIGHRSARVILEQPPAEQAVDAELAFGRVAEEGPPSKIFTEPENPRTKAFLSAVLQH